MFAISLILSQAALAADEKAAEECVQTKVWESYADGWGVRTLTSTTLAPGKTRNYMVTLYAGNEYEVKACAGENVGNLDVLLYDTNGKLIVKDEDEGRQPAIRYKPETTSTYYVVLYMRELKSGEDAAAAMAVVYK